MSRPKAYNPQQGYRYQLLIWDSYNREYDHLDYAKDKEEKDYLLNEYKLANHYGIKVIELPQKYWNNKQ